MLGLRLCLLLALTASACRHPPAAVDGKVAVRPPREIEITAVVNSRGFEEGAMAGYHLLVARTGGAADHALLSADAQDLAVLDALESLGARPGDNLPLAVWDERSDPASTAPDRVIAGPTVDLLLRLPEHPGLVPLREVLDDPGGRGIELRLGGNRANAPRWRSGCVVCLYSCPGSKIGNSRYTVRDFTRGATRFRVRPGTLPPDGTRVGVVVRLLGLSP